MHSTFGANFTQAVKLKSAVIAKEEVLHCTQNERKKGQPAAYHKTSTIET